MDSRENCSGDGSEEMVVRREQLRQDREREISGYGG